ncbi:FBP domain-containing protein [Amnibacterium endophyticum]|uniref:FBP domain-containing protein n=1 Tax=Amnibacterium endophyticum TaxID=2109337 RepID=A0ABW4LE48_9MICO
MHALDRAGLLTSFVNTTRKELADLTPPDLDDLAWDRLDYLGWRDPKRDRRAYVVLPADDGPVGVLLRQAEATARTRAQCSWCQDVRLPNDVVFYAAKRAGAAGRRGDTVGTLVCRDFQCSANVRVLPPLAYTGFDREAARDDRIVELQLRAAGFAAAVLGG